MRENRTTKKQERNLEWNARFAIWLGFLGEQDGKPTNSQNKAPSMHHPAPRQRLDWHWALGRHLRPAKVNKNGASIGCLGRIQELAPF